MMISRLSGAARTALTGGIVLFSIGLPCIVSAQSFKDLPSTHPAYEAAEFLKQQGVLQGYADGTFQPAHKLTRAEAVKILVSTKIKGDMAQFSGSSYTDVPASVWYAPYTQAALTSLHIIDGPPKTSTFNGERLVKKVEFLKMLFAVSGDNPGSYGEIMLPLATDVTDATAWFYPHMRYALSATMILVQPDGTLQPAQDLTRADAAILLYRLAMYKAGRRAQAGLSAVESDLVNVLEMLDQKQIPQAEYASARAMVMARGALTSKPNVTIVQAAVKISEAFRALVGAYKAGTDGTLDQTIALSKDAWNLAERAKQLSPSIVDLSGRVQTIAGNMAAQARSLQTQP